MLTWLISRHFSGCLECPERLESARCEQSTVEKDLLRRRAKGGGHVSQSIAWCTADLIDSMHGTCCARTRQKVARETKGNGNTVPAKTPEPFPDTRTTLIRRLASNADDEWRTFLAIYGPLVYRIGRRAGLAESDAEEVLANVMRGFVQAVQGGFKVDHSLGMFRSYLKTITTNEITAWRRQQRRQAASRPLEDTAADSHAPDARWEDAERQQRWRVCLEKVRGSRSVRKRDFEAFRRYALEGQPAERVAEDLGITTNRLYGIKHDIMKQLRRIWGKLARELGEV